MSAGEPESESSGLDFEETELKLAPPGGGSRSSAATADSERKRGLSDVELTLGAPSGVPGMDLSPVSLESKVSKPPAKAQVVGWPPVRSFRKNALKSSSCRRSVKVAMDGAPYLRKVDLEMYSGYQQLLSALEEMFSCFTIRNDPDERRLVDTASGTEYLPTYEDKDGDWMLVGDVPWKMFVESCRRLRLMKSSEAVNLGCLRFSGYIRVSFLPRQRGHRLSCNVNTCSSKPHRSKMLQSAPPKLILAPRTP